jgi:hypothetical protein
MRISPHIYLYDLFYVIMNIFINIKTIYEFMITSETSYKLSEIIRDTWPGLYRFDKVTYNNQKTKHNERILDSDRKNNG